MNSILEFKEDEFISKRELNVWDFMKKLDEKEWCFNEMSKEDIEKIIEILVALFYEIDLKGTSSNIKFILGKLMTFQSEHKEIVEIYNEKYKFFIG